jgi:hypothetical protein
MTAGTIGAESVSIGKTGTAADTPYRLTGWP